MLTIADARSTRARAPRPHDGRARAGPATPHWDDARQAWNLAVDQRPRAVAYPRDAPATSWRSSSFARDDGLRVAAAGHRPQRRRRSARSPTRSSEDLGMRGVEIDPVTRIARVRRRRARVDVTAAGRAARPRRRSPAPRTTWASSATRSAAASAGSPASHGLAANSVTAIELVTADGEFLRADAEQRPRAVLGAARRRRQLRRRHGASSSALYPVPRGLRRHVIWPWERAAEVLRRLAPSGPDALPDERDHVGRILQLPPLPEIPEPLRGRQLVVIEAPPRRRRRAAPSCSRRCARSGPRSTRSRWCPAAALRACTWTRRSPTPGVGDYAMLDDLPADGDRRARRLAGPGSARRC